VAVCGKLYAICQSVLHVPNEFHCSARVAVANEPRNDELGVGLDRGPRPNVTASDPASRRWGVALFRVAEAPDFVALNARCLDVAHRVRMEGGARTAGID
jgi:hypothetical protein